MVKYFSDGMAHTHRTNLSLRDNARREYDQTAPQKDLMRSARFAFLHRSVTAIRITKHLGFPQCHIAFRPCNAYIIGPYVDTQQWRCGSEAVSHRRHHRNCRSNNNPENFWAGLVSHWEPCELHQRAVLHAASKEMPSFRSNKDRKKDALNSTQKAASAITGGK
ncbi:hypothetical protein TcCL_Unassigned04014 [Trypanosoma cruzi]|nr:hypothetical protein TcCL_Unassigned04014 [Trypanosoma cruzi]